MRVEKETTITLDKDSISPLITSLASHCLSKSQFYQLKELTDILIHTSNNTVRGFQSVSITVKLDER